MKFRIANMACGGCAKGVTATAKTVDPVAAVQTDLERREVVIQGTTIPVSVYVAALADAGWQVEAPAS